MKKKKTVKKTGKAKQVIGFIGAGNMAHAMMRAFCGKWDMVATDVDMKKAEDAQKKFGVTAVVSIAELVKKSGTVIIAVKPANIGGVLDEMKGLITEGREIISIVAGVTIKSIQEKLGRAAVVRVMPNTPVLVNEGTCAYSASGEYRGGMAEVLLKAACRVAIKLDEDKINAVTAISGSGRAYFFYVAEAMQKAGLDMGLSGEHLRELIGQTMKGAGEMILKSHDTAGALRARVTSKGGTTEQAIRVMEEKRMNEIIIEAVIAAKNRAEELGK